MLITTVISNETTNKFTKYAKLFQNVTIFYRQQLASLFQVQEKLETCRELKWNFSNSCFIADDGHVKVVWLYALVFTEHDISWCFNVHLLRISSKNCFNSLNCSNQIVMQVSKFRK